ncbi:unnamed protein product [Darwinula stevensoni]|uniref:Uncharacterized protein n=1 Tax=Darwinula stevensoni TaxID=69355 RepID=A0A7R8XF98_9CRUS|nr:unnamed protein product [Darwinula stevensoni]CAG0895299.1 unnamed protein product [Darwinula stevensoni]
METASCKKALCLAFMIRCHLIERLCLECNKLKEVLKFNPNEEAQPMTQLYLPSADAPICKAEASLRSADSKYGDRDALGAPTCCPAEGSAKLHIGQDEGVKERMARYGPPSVGTGELFSSTHYLT